MPHQSTHAGAHHLDFDPAILCTSVARAIVRNGLTLATTIGHDARLVDARRYQVSLDGLGAAHVPAGKVYTAQDISEDPHYRARDMLLKQTTRDGYEVEVPGIVPKLSATPGRVRSSAPHLGDDTDAVLAEAGLTPEQIALLRSKGVIQ